MQGIDQKTKIHMPCLYGATLEGGRKFSLKHRLVFSYLLYQHRHDSSPSDSKVHLNTGLSRATVGEVRRELEAFGWWGGAGPTNKYLDYTLSTANNKYGYQFLYCYVHGPGRPMSHGPIAVWSLLYHYYQAGLRLPQKLTYGWLESCFGMADGSGKNCLDALQAAGWLRYTYDGVLNTKLRTLKPEHLACLQDKRTLATAEGMGSVGLDDSEPEPFPAHAPSLQPKPKSGTIDINTTKYEGLYANEEQRALQFSVILDSGLQGVEGWAGHRDAALRRALKDFREHQLPEFIEYLRDAIPKHRNRTLHVPSVPGIPHND